jgi:cyclic-di-AMP phosphodiesterase PgpH
LSRWLRQRWWLFGLRRRRAPKEAAYRRGPLLTFVAFGLLLGLALGSVLAIPLSASAAIVVGAPSPVTVNAPREITFESDVLTRKARDAAANNPANIQYTVDPRVQAEQRAAMQAEFEAISRVREDDTLTTAEQEAAVQALDGPSISAELAAQIVALDNSRWQQVTDEARRVYDAIWQERVAGISEADLQALRERELPYVNIATGLSEAERNIVLSFVNTYLKPNRTVDQVATDLQREAARAAVRPVNVQIARGQNIVREGDIVDDEDYEKLSKLGIVFGFGGTAAIAQNLLLGVLAGWLFGTYLLRYQAELWRNRRALAVIAVLMVTMVLVARLVIPSWEGAPYAFPLAGLAILLTVLFDGRVGLLAALTVAPLIGMQSEQSIGLTLTLILSSAAGVYVAQRAVQNISFVWVGLAVALLTALGAFVFWLDPLNGLAGAMSIPLWALINGAASGVLAFGSYHFLGRLANVVTPLQLMELAHPNQPLLHRLMREAPGTYHHSMVVSNLAEVAAEDIGADPLLARVGAYYHDVGKILRPYFFTDNQHERSNVHDQLDARTSARIIIDHVREGAKLAREHHLPEQVIDFIPQHHGTNLVSYFYQRALQEDEEAPIEEFRYPGPRPQTREAGIMMLADGVEATVRARAQSGKLRPARPEDDEETRSDRGMQSIAEVVEQIVTERVRSGQLDECPLTLRDIATIKQSFITTLQGIYHPRVDYPQPVAEPATTTPVVRPS